MSLLSNFLTSNYSPYFGKVWNNATMSLRTEVPASICFEIEDKKPTIIQPNGHGVSVIRRPDSAVEVIDLEDFTKTIHGNSNAPSSCDFVISPQLGARFIIFNEITKTDSRYILKFRQPNTGISQPGKLEYAKSQLEQTIERFYSVSNFCDRYQDKIALFSCRLTDKRSNSVMAKSAKSFNKTIVMLQKLKLRGNLPHGFQLHMRVYNTEYRIPK